MPTAVGQVVYKFGTDADTVYGLCESKERDPVAEEEDIKNGSNDTVGKIFSDIKTEVSFEFTPLTGFSVDEDSLIGTEITVGGETIVVQKATRKHQKGKSATFSLKGVILPHLA